MMRFGKFLTTRGVLSAIDVLSALAEQCRRRAYLPLLLADAGVVSPDFALESGASALRNDEDLLIDSYRRGLLSARQYHVLESTWKSSAPPLGEILVERGLLSFCQLNSLLTEFQSMNPHGDRCTVAMRSSG